MSDLGHLAERHAEHEVPSPSREIARLLANIGEAYGFDVETLNEIAALPFMTDESDPEAEPGAFETAHAYITSAGLDADTILASFLEQNDT